MSRRRNLNFLWKRPRKPFSPHQLGSPVDAGLPAL
jgi:hypothetical protein